MTSAPAYSASVVFLSRSELDCADDEDEDDDDEDEEVENMRRACDIAAALCQRAAAVLNAGCMMR